MRKIMRVYIIGLIAVCFAFGVKEKLVKKNKGFVLIELFSSEGCSSCPPAEKLMHKIIHRYDSLQLPVYVIEYHVDYWDYLGWKDTLAKGDYTQRQQYYGNLFTLSSIYTPQAIINGQKEMIGSDENMITQAISDGLKDSSAVNLKCDISKYSGSKIILDYSITGNIQDVELRIAVVESGLTTHVKRGENSGKTLIHDNVARVLKLVKPNSNTGNVEIEAKGINFKNSRIICFTQNAIKGNVTAACQLKIK